MEGELMTQGAPTTIGSAQPLEGSVMVDTVGETIESQPSFEKNNNLGIDNSADAILQSATEDGFEKTLEKLANEEFDQIFPDEIEESHEEGDIIEEPQELVEGDKIEDEADKEPENEVLTQKRLELESQVADLTERNEELVRRVETVEAQAKISAETMRAFLQLLKKTLEEQEKEKDEKKKVNIIDLMIAMISFFLRSLYEDAALEPSKTQEKKVNAKSGNIENQPV